MSISSVLEHRHKVNTKQERKYKNKKNKTKGVLADAFST